MGVRAAGQHNATAGEEGCSGLSGQSRGCWETLGHLTKTQSLVLLGWIRDNTVHFHLLTRKQTRSQKLPLHVYMCMLCVHMRMCLSAYVCMYVHVHRETRGWHWESSSISLYLPRWGSLTESEGVMKLRQRTGKKLSGGCHS